MTAPAPSTAAPTSTPTEESTDDVKCDSAGEDKVLSAEWYVVLGTRDGRRGSDHGKYVKMFAADVSSGSTTPAPKSGL